ncbi:2'-5' RNA ligase family protein [Abyssisolibacter fermentans]|uniref:2'-5' RNA ligase family protein n=1 Tax=Abyssisolibacter fermentans TaxID=1766203 RepID=UPI00083660C8|nr:2'-5' RNA ligase family protein [Abyssisolibacter fermentans]
MGYGLEIYFDKESENKLINLWKELHDNGFSSFMYKYGEHPHISFGVFDDDLQDVKHLKQLVIDYFNNIPQFELTLSTLGMFAGNSGVSFISPKITKQLLDYHEKFYNKLCDNGYNKWFDEYYNPENWIPHCTMTFKTTPENQMKSLELLDSLFKPFTARVEKVAFIEFYPVKYIEVVELKENV